MPLPTLSPTELERIMRDTRDGLGPSADGARRMECEIERVWAILAAVNAGLTAQQEHRDATRSLVDFWAEGEKV